MKSQETDSGLITDIHPEEAKSKAIKSVKWSFLGFVLPQIIHPVVTIILARILTPEDYGIFGISSMVIGFLTSFQGLTMGYVLTRHEKKNLNEAANVTFWVGIFGGLFFFALIQLLAPAIAQFFHEARALAVIRIQAFAILPISFVPVQQAMLQRSYAFSKLFIRNAVPILIPFFVAIPLAMTGFGYWALVFNVIVGNLASSITLWLASPWRPQFQFDIRVAIPMIQLAVWIMLERFLDWSLITVDRAFIGKIFGVHELGIYSLSKNISITIITTLIYTLSPIAYTYLSGVRNDVNRFHSSYIRLINFSAILVFPVGIGVITVAPDLVRLAFGEKWIDSIIPLQLLIMGDAMWYLFYYNADAFRAMAKANFTVLVRISMLLCLSVVFLVLAKYGFNYFCAGVFISASLLAPLQFILAVKVTGISARVLIMSILKPLTAALIMGMVVYLGHSLWQNLGFPLFWMLIAQILLGIASYIFTLWTIDKNCVSEIYQFGLKIANLKKA